MTYDVIGRAKQAREWRVEYIVVRELWLNAGRICSILSFLCAVIFFPPEKSLPFLLCILGAGHFLIYFAVKNVKYDEGNVNKTSVVAQGSTQNQTEPEG
jgi:YQGE family putative transporter